MEAVHELELLLEAGHPLLAVETWEEERLEQTLQRLGTKRGLRLFTWSVADGLRREGDRTRLYDSKEPERALRNVADLAVESIWFFKDLHRFLDRPEVVRTLRDMCGGGRRRDRRQIIVLAAPKLEIPTELEKTAVRFRLALPDERELGKLVHDVVREMGRRGVIDVRLDDAAYRRLLRSLKGLTLAEAERAVTEAILDDMALTGDDVETVQRAKRDLLAKGGVLEYLPHRANAPTLGGLETFKAWIRKREKAFTPEAEAFGLPPPKGVILLGVQGCGKSMAARAVAEMWSLPLFKLEPSRLYDMYIGESEKNLEEAIWLAEHMSPCVLLLDELEKGLTAGGSGSADGGLSKRLLGRLLGWLQDREKPVFVLATSNDVHQLPPELLRKGRFDEVFFVDLPNARERSEILALHLASRKRDAGTFDLERLAQVAEGFSGAELEQAIVSALYSAFAEGRDLDTDLLAAEIASTRPLSVTRRESIDALRAWAAERAVAAR